MKNINTYYEKNSMIVSNLSYELTDWGMKMENIKILIGSPVYQKPRILEEFLISLSKLNTDSFEVTYFFIDDNENEESKEILNRYKSILSNTVIKKSNESGIYNTDGSTHLWTENLIWKVADFKNHIIDYTIVNNFDYLFLIDSDIILHPETIRHLINQNKDIISEIFWTKWQPDSIELPQVWVNDQYTLYKKDREENLENEEINNRILDFINQLKEPGVYEVGGLGACTLISRNALQKGVNFSEIPNVSFWGEDRHFCIRAMALGIKLHVDTHFPAYHIYRESDINGIREFYNSISNIEKPKNYEELINILKSGIENLGTYNYLTGYKRDWSIYFQGYLKENLLKEALSNQDISLEERLVVKATVDNLSLISDDDNFVKFNFNLMNEGISKGKSFFERMNCNASLTKNRETWSITEFNVDNYL